MPANIENAAEDLVALLKRTLAEAGKDLATAAGELRVAFAASVRALAAIRAANESGFEEALGVERDTLRLKVAGAAVDQGDKTDARIWGIIDGALTALARVAV